MEDRVRVLASVADALFPPLKNKALLSLKDGDELSAQLYSISGGDSDELVLKVSPVSLQVENTKSNMMRVSAAATSESAFERKQTRFGGALLQAVEVIETRLTPESRKDLNL